MAPGPQKQFDRGSALEKAMEVFWEHGFEAAGLSELTERMGIGRQSLYNTFGDKRSLYIEAIKHYFGQAMGPVIAQLKAPGSPLENLLEVFRLLGERLEQKAHLGCLVGNASAEIGGLDPGAAQLLSGYFDTVEDAFEDALRRAQEADEIRSDVDSRSLARLVVRMGQGMVLLHKVRPDIRVAHEVSQSLVALITKR